VRLVDSGFTDETQRKEHVEGWIAEPAEMRELAQR
jgi:hypothetical protein